MERFLERVSVSEYRNNFILKGGMLVASIVGVDMRATMDIDTTVKALPLNEKDGIPAHKIGRQWKFKKEELDEWVKSGKSAE